MGLLAIGPGVRPVLSVQTTTHVRFIDSSTLNLAPVMTVAIF